MTYVGLGHLERHYVDANDPNRRVRIEGDVLDWLCLTIDWLFTFSADWKKKTKHKSQHREINLPTPAVWAPTSSGLKLRRVAFQRWAPWHWQPTTCWLPSGRSEKKLPRREKRRSRSKIQVFPQTRRFQSSTSLDNIGAPLRLLRTPTHTRKLRRVRQYGGVQTNTFKTHELIIKILGCIHATACLPENYIVFILQCPSTRHCSPSLRIDRRDSDAASLHSAGLMHWRRLLCNETRALTVRPLNSHSFRPVMVAFGQLPPRITKLWTWLVGGN